MDRSAVHEPVLRDELLRLLLPADRDVVLDCTVGLGGHAEAMLDAAGERAVLIGIDADEDNLRTTRRRLVRFGSRVRLFHANFDQAVDVLSEAGAAAANVVVADLGVSSNQLDDPARGFSFLTDGPLDMRMDRSVERTAADLVNALGETELADVIFRYGQERYSRRIARAVVAARKHERIERTSRLSRIVTGAIPGVARRSRRGVHPATRTFQAIRIAVNDELGSLERLLALLGGILAVGGRAGIISFHSLDDRLVKRAFAEWSATGAARLLVKKPIIASVEEIDRNPRSRSAKLRGIERLA